MAIINVEDAYILNETGAQVDKVTGLYFKDESTTAAEKAFAQLNIGTAGSNRNLLDNPWFTVNQRSASGTISSANTYTVDRWKLSGGSVIVSADGVSLLKVGSTEGAYRQYIEYDRTKTNEQYTLSVMLQSGEVYSMTGVLTPQTAQSSWLINRNFTSGLWGGIRAYGPNAEFWDICFTSNKTSGVALRAVKLELGSVSTLANDTPPDYGTELLKCMRYFVRLNYTSVTEPIGYGYAYSASQARILMPTPVPMRANPTISATAIANLRINCNGTYLTPTGFTSTGTVFPNGIAVHFGVSGATSGTLALLFSYDAMYIDFSADL